MPESPVTLRAENVHKRIGDAILIDAVDLEVRAGEKIALIGPSGAGKTTLLRLFAGLLWPSSGRVETLGQDTAALRGRALRETRRRVGLLYQSDNLIPGLRVAHNVAMGRLGRTSLLRAAADLLWPSHLDEVRAALAEVELAHKLWALPGNLSGGEQQRVALARLLVQRPDVILADEPVSALDVRLGRGVLDLLTGIADRQGATLVVSLHDLSLVDGRFDRVVGMQNGRVTYLGSPTAFDSAQLRALFGDEVEDPRNRRP